MTLTMIIATCAVPIQMCSKQRAKKKVLRDKSTENNDKK